MDLVIKTDYYVYYFEQCFQCLSKTINCMKEKFVLCFSAKKELLCFEYIHAKIWPQ
jgi:hypothetical protein